MCILAVRLAVLNCVAAIPGEIGRKTRGGLVDPPEIVDLPEAASSLCNLFWKLVLVCSEGVPGRPCSRPAEAEQNAKQSPCEMDSFQAALCDMQLFRGRGGTQS